MEFDYPLTSLKLCLAGEKQSDFQNHRFKPGVVFGRQRAAIFYKR